MGQFDFDVIRGALPYLFQTGMTFTLTLTVLSRFKLLSVPAGITFT